jgi:hypothetical protein
LKRVPELRNAVAKPAREAVNYLWTLGWRLRVAFGPPVDLDASERLTVVLVSYLRPANMERIVRAALKCKFVNKIVVQNNNPEIDIRDWIGVSDDRLRIVNSPVRRGAGSRWFVAREENEAYYLAIDDDVFLFPGQIARLFSNLLNDPDVPHGVHGILTGKSRRQTHVARREATVDILHQLYLATGDHVRRYHEILATLERDAPDARAIADHFGDDVIISNCGNGAPRIHNVGFVPRCASSHRRGIALNQLDEFTVDRGTLHRKLREVVPGARATSHGTF